MINLPLGIIMLYIFKIKCSTTKI